MITAEQLRDVVDALAALRAQAAELGRRVDRIEQQLAERQLTERSAGQGGARCA